MFIWNALFWFLSYQTSSSISRKAMTAYTFLLLFMYRWPNRTSGWVSKDIKSVGFFSIHRTQLHLNKLTPSARLAAAENTTQPQTLKLNHSHKYRSHRYFVKYSLIHLCAQDTRANANIHHGKNLLHFFL